MQDSESFDIPSDVVDFLQLDGLIDACFAQEPRVIEHACKPEVLSTLLDIALLPSSSDDPVEMFLMPSLACQVMSTGCNAMTDALCLNDCLLVDKLFSILDDPLTVSPCCANYFTQICTVLVQQQPSKMDQYFRSSEDMLRKMLGLVKHSAFLEIIKVIVYHGEHFPRLGIRQWLVEQDLVGQLLQLLVEGEEESRKNAVQLWIDILAMVSQPLTEEWAEPSPVLTEMVGPRSAEFLMSHCLSMTNTSSFQHCISAALGVLDLWSPLEKHPPAIQASLRTLLDQRGVAPVTAACLKNMEELMALLRSSTLDDVAVYKASNRFGHSRLKIIELLIGLAKVSPADVAFETFGNHNVVGQVADLIVVFPWNNILHFFVAEFIVNVMTNSSHDARHSALRSSSLHTSLLAAVEANTASVRDTGLRLGFMGYVIMIGQHLAALNMPDAPGAWRDFVSTELLSTVKLYGTPLCDAMPGPGSAAPPVAPAILIDERTEREALNG